MKKTIIITLTILFVPILIYLFWPLAIADFEEKVNHKALDTKESYLNSLKFKWA